MKIYENISMQSSGKRPAMQTQITAGSNLKPYNASALDAFETFGRAFVNISKSFSSGASFKGDNTDSSEMSESEFEELKNKYLPVLENFCEDVNMGIYSINKYNIRTILKIISNETLKSNNGI